jgi:hypothetical protein
MINGMEIIPERHNSVFAIIALIVFLFSSVLIVVATLFGKRHTYIRYFGIIFLISNFAYILLILYVLQ